MNAPLLTTDFGQLVELESKFTASRAYQDSARTHSFNLCYLNDVVKVRMLGYKVALTIYEVDPQSNPKFREDLDQVRLRETLTIK